MKQLETVSFRNRIQYPATGSGIEVSIGIKVDDKRAVRLTAKVDTGADFCIFKREYAEALGIDVETGELKRFETATAPFDAYGHTVTLSCLDWNFDTIVYFAAQAEFPRNVLGRFGWLQQFRIGIIDYDSTLLLSRYDDD